MTYLLDTHYMLWALTDTKKISKRIKDVIVEPDNRIVISTVSFWEISLKTSKGKMTYSGLPSENLPDACRQIGFEIECLPAADSSTYHKLIASHHKDPFDRMLIWQAIQNNYTFISVDIDVRKYKSEGLKILAA